MAQTTKQSTPKLPAQKSKSTAVVQTSSIKDASLFERYKLRRADRKRSKQLANQTAERQAKRLAAARQKDEIRAQRAAIQAAATQEVEQAVTKSHKRRSHPLFTLLVLLVVIGLSGAAVWYYRQSLVLDQQQRIADLQQQNGLYAKQKQANQAAQRVEAAKYQMVDAMGISLRLPSDWKTQSSQLPQNDTVYGNDNVTLHIIKNESQNSISQYIPAIDYVWQLSSSDAQSFSIASQSLRCDRFDSLDNDLQKSVRQHSGFQVYCNPDPEKTVIFVAANPGHYGASPANVYFMIEIKDIQQVNFADLKTYIQSASINVD